MDETAIWTEKFRPKTFNEVKGQQEIVKRVEAFVKQQNMPHLLFAGPAGIGKCVTEETPILTGNGSVKTIKECYDEKITAVMSLDPQGNISKRKIAYLYKEQADKTLQIKTSSGKKVRVTPEHPFLILTKGVPTWTQAQDIKTNDLVATPSLTQKGTNHSLANWKNTSFWAKTKTSVRVNQEDLLFGVQKEVYLYIKKNPHSTIKQISSKIKNPIGNVIWATSEIAKKNIITKKGIKSTKHSVITTTVHVKELPLSLLSDVNNIQSIYYNYQNKKSCNINFFTHMNADFYEWLGLVYGDGHIRKSSIRFYNKNEQLLNKFKELSIKVFGSDIVFQEKERLNVPYIEILRATTITKVLEENFTVPIGSKKSDKITVPQQLFSAKEELVSAFIRGFFECDGSFYKNVAEISSASQEFIYGLSYLLLRWDIHPRIKRRNNQSYLLLHNNSEVNRFYKIINPLFKNPKTISTIENTNTDIMFIDSQSLITILDTLGIQRNELGRKSEINYIFERKKASRQKVQEIYKKIIKLSQRKIKQGLETISLCNTLDVDFKEQINALFQHLQIAHNRTQLNNEGTIRYDRLKEYAEEKRKPTLTNLLSMIKSMRNLKYSGAEKSYEQLTKILLVKEKIVQSMNLFNISYNEIASQTKEYSHTINHCLTNSNMSYQSVTKLIQLITNIKIILEQKILDQTLLQSLELIQYLSTAQIRWDPIKEIINMPSAEVYDLNVEETHNFIGGHGPILLHNTTLSLVTARAFFGDQWHENFLELNASDERGIDVVRVKVKDFARTKALGNVPFKIIYLDECDALTKEAQQALRRTMENYTQTTRFILSCNYSSKIIDPIQSRCTIFRFKPLAEADINEIIDTIIKKEGLKIDAETRKALYDVSGGDVRRLENILQASAAIQKEITAKLIYSIASYARPGEVKNILESCIKANFAEAKKQLLKTMLDYGLAGIDVIKQLQQAVWTLENVEDRKKLEMSKACGEIEFRMIEGADEFVQLESLLATFILQTQ